MLLIEKKKIANYVVFFLIFLISSLHLRF